MGSYRRVKFTEHDAYATQEVWDPVVFLSRKFIIVCALTWAKLTISSNLSIVHIFISDVSLGTKLLKLDSGETIEMPKVVRTVTRSTMISQYIQFCQEKCEPLSRSSSCFVDSRSQESPSEKVIARAWQYCRKWFCCFPDGWKDSWWSRERRIGKAMVHWSQRKAKRRKTLLEDWLSCPLQAWYGYMPRPLPKFCSQWWARYRFPGKLHPPALWNVRWLFESAKFSWWSKKSN